MSTIHDRERSRREEVDQQFVMATNFAAYPSWKVVTLEMDVHGEITRCHFRSSEAFGPLGITDYTTDRNSVPLSDEDLKEAVKDNGKTRVRFLMRGEALGTCIRYAEGSRGLPMINELCMITKLP